MNKIARAGTTASALAVFVLVLASPAFAPCHSIVFADSPYSVAENAGKVTITVSNGAGAQTQDEFVDYKTVNGTAKAGSDYVGKSGTVMFGANSGAAQLSFDIVIKDNKLHENIERFTVELSNVRPPSSCVPPPSIDESSATVTITDNDAVLQPKPTPTPTPTKNSPKPTPTKSASPSPSPSPSTQSPTPSPTSSAVATANDSGGGLSGGALAAILVAAVAAGGVGVYFVRRRFLT